MNKNKQNVIDSDALGKKGESRFRELCADTGLTFNSSLDWDKAGWDFIIDFELDESGSTSLDHRKTPLSCRVQQKTILDSTESVRLSLKMAERLAKEAIPSFISILKVSADLQFTKAYLIHMAGSRLASILERLRKEGSKASSEELKDKFIYFTPIEEEEISISGSALREALKRHIGSDMHAYVEKKKTELQCIGYDDSAHTMEFIVSKKDTLALREMFLGKKTELQVKNFHYGETRFGILHKYRAKTSGKFKLSVPSYGHCSIMFLNGKGDSSSFEGEIYACPPELGGVVRVASELMQIDFRSNVGDDDIAISVNINAEGKSCSVYEWINYWKAICVAQSKDGFLRVKTKNSTPYMELSLSSSKLTEPLDHAEYCLKLLEMLQRIQVLSGFDAGYKFTHEDYLNSSEKIEIFYNLTKDDGGPITAEIFATNEQVKSFFGAVPFVEDVKICGLVIACFGMADICSCSYDGQRANISIEKIYDLNFREVKSLEEYESLVKKIKRKTDRDVILSGEYVGQ